MLHKIKFLVIFTISIAFLSSCLTLSNNTNYNNLSKRDRDLIDAIIKKDYELVLKAIKSGANTNVKSNIMVQKLIEKIGVKQTMAFLHIENEKDLEKLFHSALNVAIYLSSPQIIQLLLDNKAEPNEATSTSNLLFLAVSLNKYDVLKMLILAGGNVKNGYITILRAGYNQKLNLLEYAINSIHNNTEIIKLIENEFKKDSKTKEKQATI